MHAAPRHRLVGHDLFGSNRIPISVRKAIVNGDHFPHDHDFMEIVVINGGSGHHVSMGTKQACETGAVYILRPGTWHTYENCSQLAVTNVCFAASMLRNELRIPLSQPDIHDLLMTQTLREESEGLASLVLSSESLERAKTYLMGAEAALAESSPVASVQVIGYITLFLSALGTAAELRRTSQNGSFFNQRGVPQLAVDAAQLLDNNIAAQWNLTLLSQELFVDPSHLVRVFKGAMGLPPMAYLSRCRAESSASLLVRTDLSVSQIGIQVGWEDSNYFSRRFKQHFRLTPTAYRRRFGARSCP